MVGEINYDLYLLWAEKSNYQLDIFPISGYVQ